MISKTKKFSNGAEVHPIGIGTWTIGGGMVAETGGEDEAIEAIRYSVKKGQNHIDTAEMYGDGHSEEVVGQAIKGLDRKKLFIASKLYRGKRTVKDVLKATENILRRLKTDYLDLLYIHAYWENEDISVYLEGINEVQDKDLAKTIGVSNFDAEELKWAVKNSKNPIVANQMNYNVLYQTEIPEEMKDFCKKEKIMIVAYRPVERGVLADQCEDKTILRIAEKYRKTPAQIAINWLISQENVVTIPKSTNKKHIDENLGAMDFEMEEEDIRMLNNLSF